MPKIHILFVVTKLELGGAQKQLLTLIRHLDQNKYKPFLFTAAEGYLVAQAQSINGLTLERSKALERAINPFKDLRALIEIIRFIKKNNIRVVHTHSSKAGIIGRLAARFAGADVIVHTVHGWSFNDYQPYFLRNLFVLLERITSLFTDRLIVVSNHDKFKGLNNGIGKEEQYSLIRYGIDGKEFMGEDKNVRKELRLSPTDLTVGMISCLKPQKSPEDFIKLAFLVNQCLPHTKFILIGDGILRKKIEKLISKFHLGQEIILTGWREDIPEILAGIDVFVLTSLWEGLPLSVLEAMAASRPVVATHTGGIEDVVIDGQTGFLVNRRPLVKMAEKVTMLLRDGHLRRGMGQRARDFLASDFSTQGMAKQNQDLYESLIGTQGK